MTISITMGVSLLAYLSGRLVWDFLAHLFWDWVAPFHRDLKWHLSGDLGTDRPGLIMTSGWTWNNSGGINAFGFGDWYTPWYFNRAWDLDWNWFANALDLNLASWCNSNGCGCNCKWSWSYKWSSTKARQEEALSITSLGIRISFRIGFGVTLGN